MLYLVRDINSPIPKFTYPRFFYRIIYRYYCFFWIEIIQPFLNLEGASKCILQHHQNKSYVTLNFVKKDIRGLVKINW